MLNYNQTDWTEAASVKAASTSTGGTRMHTQHKPQSLTPRLRPILPIFSTQIMKTHEQSSTPGPPLPLPLLSPAALASHRAGARDKPLKTMRMIMADAAAPQNSISTGTSMRMSVKVKYARRRVLKEGLAETTTSDEEDDEGKKQERERERERKKTGKGEKKMKIMCLYFSASRHNPTGILSSPALTTDCE